MTEEQIKEMARRFLQWKLPDDFHPDGGISFKAAFNEHTAHPARHEPVGTNLLTFAQAVEMVRHMVAALEAQPAQEPVAHWYTGPTEEQATAALRAKLAEVEREREWWSSNQVGATDLLNTMANALTRQAHALAAETVKREAMEAELRSVEIDLFEAEDKFHVASFFISDEQTRQCVMDRVKWMAKAGSRVRATLAKHGSKT